MKRLSISIRVCRTNSRLSTDFSSLSGSDYSVSRIRAKTSLALWRSLSSSCFNRLSISINRFSLLSLPSFITWTPFGVGIIVIERLSEVLTSLRASPCCTSASTILLIVGGWTCSAWASSWRDLGPPKTMTDRAESCDGPIPEAESWVLRSRRR